MYIDKFEPLWLNQLDSRTERLSSNERLYLLIDGVFVPGIYRRISDILSTRAVRLLFEFLPGCNDESRAVSPMLVAYQANCAPLAAALQACCGFPMVSAIVTNETIDQLAERLAAWCIVACDGQRFNFRFPDTRRLPTILNVLTDEQKEQMLGPAHEILYVGRDGRWKAAQVNPSDRGPISNPELSDQQFSEMVRDSEADQATAQLHQRGAEIYTSPSVTFACVQSALKLAAHGGLDELARIEWCEYCLGKQLASVDDLRRELRNWAAARSAGQAPI